MKENWAQQNITLKDLKEIDIEVLGKIVQGLTLNDLKELSEDAQLVAFKQLGKYTGLPEDKLKSRANFAYKFFEVTYLNPFSSFVLLISITCSLLSSNFSSF